MKKPNQCLAYALKSDDSQEEPNENANIQAYAVKSDDGQEEPEKTNSWLML